jgi:hypothetical protein
MTSFFRHNYENLRSPRDILDAVENHPCGTVACIAGHAVILALQNKDVPNTNSNRDLDISTIARNWLGLNNRQEDNLFYGDWNDEDCKVSLHDLTKTQAINELTRLIEANS